MVWLLKKSLTLVNAAYPSNSRRVLGEERQTIHMSISSFIDYFYRCLKALQCERKCFSHVMKRAVLNLSVRDYANMLIREIECEHIF